MSKEDFILLFNRIDYLLGYGIIFFIGFCVGGMIERWRWI